MALSGASPLPRARRGRKMRMGMLWLPLVDGTAMSSAP